MITKKFFVVWTFSLLVSCKTQLRENDSPGHELKKPNILIIYVDDLGYGDLSSYGGKTPTPNIDKIGKEGIRFTDFHVSAPGCTPSRYSLLTGAYPQRSHNGLDWVIYQWHDAYFNRNEIIMPNYLKNKGYQTALMGKWHLGGNPLDYDFDRFVGHKEGHLGYYGHVTVFPYTKKGTYGLDWYINNECRDEEGYATDLITNHTIETLDDFSSGDKPFFIYLAYNAPHYGCGTKELTPVENAVNIDTGYAPKEFDRLFASLEAPTEYIDKFADVENIYERYYMAMLSNLDDNIGRVWQKLDEEGILENTLIWFISDNGGYSNNSDIEYGKNPHASNGPLRGSKGMLYEGGIRVPSLLCWKEKIKPGQVRDQLLINIDVLPTLGSMIGFSEELKNNTIDGMDIKNVIFNNEPMERELFWKYRGGHGQIAYRDGDWKIYQDELYNLANDIGEKNNLAEKYPGIYAKLKAKHDSVDANMTKFNEFKK